ncbi:hypothetical protein [Nocardioides sp.]|uniref:hypothetical protein n=1 Tax=Nocardioides sp. TaxID=35761 RepID=UPI002602D386|nr:hypothetical protein [Nocardioides sp.]MDI6911482.1 hypothetical protein [Nocardioides sp.]
MATEHEPDEGERAAAPGSALAGLRRRREEAAAKLYLDLAVPRLDPPVYVRYKPVDQRTLDLANKRARESKDPDRLVIANAVALSHACIGVFGEVDGQPEGNPEDWPKFDSRLRELLGLPEDASAVETVRTLYLTDGDVIAAASELAEWSGMVARRTDEEIAGN